MYLESVPSLLFLGWLSTHQVGEQATKRSLRFPHLLPTLDTLIVTASICHEAGEDTAGGRR